MTVRKRNRVWTSDDFRALRSALRTAENIKEAAKRLNRDPSEVEGMARDIGWIVWPAVGTRGRRALAHGAQRFSPLGGDGFKLSEPSLHIVQSAAHFTLGPQLGNLAGHGRHLGAQCVERGPVLFLDGPDHVPQSHRSSSDRGLSNCRRM